MSGKYFLKLGNSLFNCCLKRVGVTVMISFLLTYIFLTPFSSHAQTPEMPSHAMEQQLENNTENNDDVEPDDDAYPQLQHQFIKNPINLNVASEAELQELQLLTPLQIHQLILYREIMGKLLSVYELQAIPLWDLSTIQKVRLYIIVSTSVQIISSIKTRFQNGDHSVLFRMSEVPERSKGYLLYDSTAKNYYTGSPQKILFRYAYNYKHLLQYGIVTTKDAGEQFFKGSQKQGFDFYSAHLFLRNAGILQALALGDFTVNMGQGLIQWQSLAFKKSVSVVSIKREGPILRPYNSAGEINFHRGIGITIGKKLWQSTFFISYKKIDANFINDTSLLHQDYVSSFQTSGYHRTAAEIADKGIQRQLAVGGNFLYQYKLLRVGVNVIHYNYSLPLIKSDDPYNKYALNGKSFTNYSFDYSYTYRNLHLFGETAVNAAFDKATVNGLLISVSSFADMVMLYRNISKSYQSLYSNAFTESTYPINEKGLFIGISIRPNTFWQINAYTDYYKFTWLKYRVDAPSVGNDFLIQATYKPSKLLEIYSRYRIETKSINVNPDGLTLSPVVPQPRQSWRTQINYVINHSLVFRSRVEMLWFDKKGIAPEQGFLANIDVLFNPVLKPFSGNIRVQYFETDGYNSRIYAFENDILYNYSIPVLYDKGYRYYINFNYNFNKKFSIWMKWAQTFYPDKSTVGSGLDEINGNHKSEIKLQIIYQF